MCALLLLLRGNLCMITSCRPAKTACSATASRLQRPQLPETQPHKMRQPRRATRLPGLFVRFNPLPLCKSVMVCQGVTSCDMLCVMILYNRPRRRGRGRGLRRPRPTGDYTDVCSLDGCTAGRCAVASYYSGDFWARRATRDALRRRPAGRRAGGRRDARRLHRSAICAGAGGGRTRCAPVATLDAHAATGRACNEAER